MIQPVAPATAADLGQPRQQQHSHQPPRRQPPREDSFALSHQDTLVTYDKRGHIVGGSPC